jgi:uncharacterized protein involved in exopolysaccharide biosynthesis
MAEEKQSRNPRDVLRVIFRRRPLLLLAAAAFAFASLVGAHSLPLKYTGVTKFERRSDAAARGVGSDSFETVKLNLQHELAGRNAVEAVIEELGLTRGRDFPRNSEGVLTREGELSKQQLVLSMQKAITVMWEVKSLDLDFVSVNFTHSDTQLAQNVPDALVKGYIDRTVKEMAERLVASRDFLLKRVTDCQNQLTEIESKRIAFETEHAKMMPESPGAIQLQIDRVQGRITELTQRRQADDVKLEAAKKKIQHLRDQLPDLAQALASSASTQPTTQPTTQPSSRPAGMPVAATASQPAGAMVAAAEPNQPPQAAGPGTQPAAMAAATAQSQPAAMIAAAATTDPNSPATQPAGKLSPSPADMVREVVKGPNPEKRRLETELRQLEEELSSARLAGGMKDSHPRIQAVQAKIERLRKLVAEAPDEVVLHTVYGAPGTGVGPGKRAYDPLTLVAFTDAISNYELLQREVDNAAQELAKLEKERGALMALMANLAPTRQRYLEITEKVREQGTELKMWQGRLNDVQTALAAEVAKRRTHLNTVQAAQQQILPSSPNLLFVLGFCIGGALAFGAGLVFLVNLLDRSIPTTEIAMEHFEFTIHGVIGEIMSSKQRFRRKLKRWIAWPAISAVAGACVLVALMSIVLRLQFPNAYSEWKLAPLAFMYSRGIQPALEWARHLV